MQVSRARPRKLQPCPAVRDEERGRRARRLHLPDTAVCGLPAWPALRGVPLQAPPVCRCSALLRRHPLPFLNHHCFPSHVRRLGRASRR